MTVPELNPVMPPSRRALLTTALAAATVGAAGCGRRLNRHPTAAVRGLDFERLTSGFAALAARAAPGTFNLGVMTFDTLAVWCANQNRRFPMGGLVRAPVAAAALAEVDAGRLKLNDMITIRAVDLSPPPSRVNRAFPPGEDELRLPAADLIALAVQAADDTAADVITAHIGGPGAVTGWLRQHDIKDMRVDRYQREVQSDMFGVASFRAAWKDEAAWAAARTASPPEVREAAMARFLADPRDTTTAEASLSFLNLLSQGNLLSHASTDLLLRLMSTVSGPAPLGAGLPGRAALAHQSGRSATDLGFTPVTNDMGVVILPGGRRFAIAAFLAGSTATAGQRDALIAQAATLAVSALR
ncbi:MAG TPA: serine hydrolase [Caulobacteraceae bacterium]|nr:serine hydrolase [Caulobacteraceae bacterium]